MNNYRFFEDPELRYIIRGWAGVSQRTLTDVVDFCERQGINTSRWTVSPELWNIKNTRIKVDKNGSDLSLIKLDSAKRSDRVGQILILIGLAIILLGTGYLYIRGDVEQRFMYLVVLFAYPLLFGMMYVSYKRLRKINNENKLEKRLVISGSVLSFSIAVDEVLSGQIKQIVLYWREGFDASDSPTVSLDLALESGALIRVDEEGDYKELFILADKIQEHTDIMMTVHKKEPPEKYFQVL